MRNFTFKGLFLTAVFMLLGCLSIQAADDDLITKQITIKLDEAGTLPDRIGSSRKYKITNLKLVGEINGTDWEMIRAMAGGSTYYGGSTEGNLSVLDLSEAKIVEGGDYYYYDDGSHNYYNDNGYMTSNGKDYTHNDEIGDFAFFGCSRLTSLNLPAGITSIGSYAFYCCSGLTSLTLPAGITIICEGAFSGCSGLKEVRFCINDNLDTYLTKGHPYISVDCDIKYYLNDKEITSSIVIPSNVTSLGHCVFQNCSGLTSVTLPAGITTIGSSAFYGCSGLTSLNLPASLTEIGMTAFKGCSGLTSLTLPAGITSIGSSAFYGCSGLTSLTLPAGITEIGECAFYGCSGLTSVTLPAGLTQIDDYAFSECSGLTSMYVYAEKVPKIGEDVFKGCEAKKCILYVPKGTYDDYWLSDFGYFENIVEFDATGIDKTATSTDAKEVSRYSVNGQRLVDPTKGLNIVKYSDGSVKKVAVE